jgi:hypothetical protein
MWLEQVQDSTLTLFLGSTFPSIRTVMSSFVQAWLFKTLTREFQRVVALLTVYAFSCLDSFVALVSLIAAKVLQFLIVLFHLPTNLVQSMRTATVTGLVLLNAMKSHQDFLL